jgi:hypothetical protein
MRKGNLQSLTRPPSHTFHAAALHPPPAHVPRGQLLFLVLVTEGDNLGRRSMRPATAKQRQPKSGVPRPRRSQPFYNPFFFCCRFLPGAEPGIV